MTDKPTVTPLTEAGKRLLEWVGGQLEEYRATSELALAILAIEAEARDAARTDFPADPEYHEHVAGDKHSHAFNGPHSHGGVSALLYPGTYDHAGNWSCAPRTDSLDVERLAEAMNESYWPDDLPFVDDGVAFWTPFAAKVLAALDKEPKP